MGSSATPSVTILTTLLAQLALIMSFASQPARADVSPPLEAALARFGGRAGNGTAATMRVQTTTGAPFGFRDAATTAGGETAALVDGVQVTAGIPRCTGDCDGFGTVTVEELVKGVNIALGSALVGECSAVDSSGDGRVTVEELVQAVNNALNGCPSSSTPTRTPTATNTPEVTAAPPTPTTTSGPTTTPGGSTVGRSVASGAVAVANGMAVIPSVITAIVSGVQFGATRAVDVKDVVNGVSTAVDGSGTAAGCPKGGTAMRSGSLPGTMTLTLKDDCAVATADGLLIINGTATLSGFLPPLNLSANVQVRYTDASRTTTRLTASASLTGTINPQFGGICYVTGATLDLTSDSSLSTQVPGDGGVTIGFNNTKVDVAVANFNLDCTPVNYTLTFNRQASVLITSGAAAAASQSFDVTFANFAIAQDARAVPTKTEMNGAMTSACFGGTVTVQTLRALTQMVGALCPEDGKLKVTAAADGAVQIFYLAGGGVGIDSNLDDISDQSFSSCLDSALLVCVPAGTPSATITATGVASPTRTATGTFLPSATPSVTGTGVVPASPTSTATRTPSRTAPTSATSSRTATATSTPSPTPTKTSGARLYCDTLSGPLPIPDGLVDIITGDVIGVDDTITIPDNVTIEKVRVQLQINHPAVGDLVVFLDHLGAGSYTTLLDNPGVPTTQFGCQFPNVQCTFDDAAAQAADTQCSTTPPAIGGTARPFDPLDVFNGESSMGTWQLSLFDTFTPDAGTLVHWCVEVN